MSLLPEPFRSGEKVSGLRGPLNQLREAIVHILTGGLIKTGPGLVSSRQGDHYMISLLPARRSSGTVVKGSLRIVTSQPGSYSAPSTPIEDPHVWVTYGLVSGVAPSNIETAITLVEGRNYIFLAILLNANLTPQSATIETAAAVPANPGIDSETGEIDWTDPDEKIWYFELGWQEVENEEVENEEGEEELILQNVGQPANTGSGSLALETFAGNFQYIEPTETTTGGLAQTTLLRVYRIG